MSLFNLKINENVISLGEPIYPCRFQDIKKGGIVNVKEDDVESLIVVNPRLLNYSNDDAKDADLLIIARQLQTKSNKRCDLLAIDREGYLVTIEIKRDAKDEEHRAEGFEFQCIRYAASHRTLTVETLVGKFTEYLRSIDKNADPDKDYKQLAIENICKHLTDTDEIVFENLSDYLDPVNKQKLFLVASDFMPDCLSACAWLYEHNINIYCYKLQPYCINDRYCLNKELLFPPPLSEEYLVETREEKEKEQTTSKNMEPRQKTTRPAGFSWNEDKLSGCNRWTDLLNQCVRLGLESNLSVNNLPMPHTTEKEEAERFRASSEIIYHINDNEEKVVYIDRHGSRDVIERYIKAMILVDPFCWTENTA